MYLHEAEKNLIDLKNTKDQIQKKYSDDIKSIDHKINQATIDRDLLMKDFNLDKINLAKSFIYVEGVDNIGQGESGSALNDAIKDFSEGVKYLRTRYIGCKQYDGFYMQRTDCEYGYGPRHGYIIFRIGLKDTKHEFVDIEIDSCIYYIRKLKDDPEFRKIITQKVS
jgi:hypothetical protein